jgi:exopolyphosphatase/guanosine-5'-triphosphate,3'-diphosphate pyrophosphatase
MKVAVVDIGSNSTRLLVANVDPASGAVHELERRSTVTRLGQGVDANGTLAPEAMERVFTTLAGYRELIDEHEAHATTAVLTSAVRDAANGAQFTATVRDRFGLDARVIDGDEEAQLTFLGATSERDENGEAEILVIDVGGGSTELVTGHGREVDFHVSTQAGVVRQTERHIHHDPPLADELEVMGQEVAGIIRDAVPAQLRSRVTQAIAVAGTATSAAAIAQALDPYDPDKVHGYVLDASELDDMLARLAAITDDERRHVPGLHPDRAPTIVAGIVLLREALRAFGLDRFEVSEHDILRGAALRRAGVA